MKVLIFAGAIFSLTTLASSRIVDTIVLSENESYVCKASGAFPVAQDRSKFYYCIPTGEGLMPTLIPCATGFLFDQVSAKCVLPNQNEGRDGLSAIGVESSQVTSLSGNVKTSTDSSATQTTTGKFICPGLGSFADPLSTLGFYHCILNDNDGYIAIKISCGKGTEYMALIGSCGIPVDDGATVEPEPFVCPGPGFFPNPVDKRKFYYCFPDNAGGYLSIEFSCAIEFEFDPVLGECVQVEETTTVSTTVTTTQEPSSTTSSELTTTTSVPEETTVTSTTEKVTTTVEPETTTAPPVEFVCPSEGVFPNPESKTSFYFCLGNDEEGYIKILMECAKDQEFDPEQLQCMGKEISTTESSTSSTTQITTSPPVEFVCPGEGVFPNPESKQSFYFCLDDGEGGYIKILMECGKDQEFDPEQLQCMGKEMSTTESSTSSTTQSSSSTTTAVTTDESTTQESTTTSSSTTTTEESTTSSSTTTTEEPTTSTSTTTTEEPTTSSSTTTTEEPTTSSSTTTTEESTTSSSTTTTEESTTSSSTTTTEEPTTSSSTTTTEEPTTSSSTTTTEEPTTSSSTTTTEEPTTSSSTTITEEPTTSSSTTTTEEPTTSSSTAATDETTTSAATTTPSSTATPDESTTTISTTPGTSTTTDSSSTGSTVSPTTPGSSTTPAPFKCTEQGVFADPTDNTRYYYCSPNGEGGLREVLFTCPLGLVFDPVKKYCSKPDQPFITTTTTSTTAAAAASFTCTRSGMFENPKDNKSFYVCIFDGFGYISVLMECSAGLVFIEELYRCAPPDATRPPPAPVKCNSVGYVADPNSCRDYFYCYSTFEGGYLTIRMTCPAGTNYYPNMEICVSDKVLKCNIKGSGGPGSGTVPTYTTTAIADRSEFICPGPGLFPVPANSRKYYCCDLTWNGVLVLKERECRKNTRYSAYDQKCVDNYNWFKWW